jgi:hypothetical protein
MRSVDVGAELKIWCPGSSIYGDYSLANPVPDQGINSVTRTIIV